MNIDLFMETLKDEEFTREGLRDLEKALTKKEITKEEEEFLAEAEHIVHD